MKTYREEPSIPKPDRYVILYDNKTGFTLYTLPKGMSWTPKTENPLDQVFEGEAGIQKARKVLEQFGQSWRDHWNTQIGRFRVMEPAPWPGGEEVKK